MPKHLAAAVRFAVLFSCVALLAFARPAEAPADEFAQQQASELFLLSPPDADGPVVVQAAFQLLAISQIEDESEKVSFSGIIKLIWKDDRQAFDPEAAGVTEKVFSGAFQFNEVSTGWYPQVTLANASGQYDSHAVVLRVQPDGTSTLIEKVEAVAKVNIDMRLLPFDRQRLDLVFRIFGFDEDEVAFDAKAVGVSANESVSKLAQWTLEGIEASVRTLNEANSDGMGAASTFVVSMDVKRRPLFMLRLVVFPLTLIVVLSWAVFWMDRSSVGDRMAVSFVGILAAVAYQITLVGIVPNVSYFTLMNEFLNVSFLLMCATVVVNLYVSAADRRGQHEGDRIDRHCRWIFPLAFFGINALAVAFGFLRQ